MNLTLVHTGDAERVCDLPDDVSPDATSPPAALHLHCKPTTIAIRVASVIETASVTLAVHRRSGRSSDLFLFYP